MTALFARPRGSAGGHRRTFRRLGRRPPADQGQVSVEFAGLLPLLLLVGALALQAFLYSAATERVEEAARNGARIESMGGDGASAAWNGLPAGVREEMTKDYGWGVGQPSCPELCVQSDGEVARATIQARIPTLFSSAVPLDLPINATIEMPA